MPRRRRPPRAGALAELQPLRTAAQIATLQALYYVIAIVLIVFTTLVAGLPLSSNLLLGWDAVRGDTTQGWLMAFIWIFNGGFCMAVAIVVLIARSKLVPDFALTIHFLHLVITTLFTSSIPTNSMWWFTMLASSMLAVSLGMWGCQYRELQPVFFGGRILNSTGGSASRGQASAEDDDLEAAVEEDGYARGSGKGKGKDGQGTYEMVDMKATS